MELCHEDGVKLQEHTMTTAKCRALPGWHMSPAFSTIMISFRVQSCSILAKQISSSTPRPLIHIKIVASKYILFTTKSVLANNVKHLQSLISYDHVIYEVIWSIYSYDHFTYEYIWFINHDSYSTKSGEFMFELYQWRPCRGQVAVWPGTLFPNSRGNKAAANLHRYELGGIKGSRWRLAAARARRVRVTEAAAARQASEAVQGK